MTLLDTIQYNTDFRG